MVQLLHSLDRFQPLNIEDNSLVKELSESDGSPVASGKKSNKVALLGDMIASMASENDGQVLLSTDTNIEILRNIDIGIMALVLSKKVGKKVKGNRWNCNDR